MSGEGFEMRPHPFEMQSKEDDSNSAELQSAEIQTNSCHVLTCTKFILQNARKNAEEKRL